MQHEHPPRTYMWRSPSITWDVGFWPHHGYTGPMGAGRWGELGAILVVCASCNFNGDTRATAQGDEGAQTDGSMSGDGAGNTGGDASNADWWDASFGYRQQLIVTTGGRLPDRGYVGYTVRLAALDTAALVAAGQLRSDCADLRLVYWDSTSWTEAPRHLSDCNSDTSTLAFALPANLGVDETWANAYLYFGHSEAAAGPALTTDNVYLWWDDAAQDRSADYAHGRMDAWLSTGHDDSLGHNGGGYYEYATGDDTQSSYRRAVDERDVLIEAEFFHTGCWSLNMQTGVCVRGIIDSGSGASESSDHYYCTTRAQNPACSDADQGLYDGDIVKRDNEDIALQGVIDPPPLVASQWRKQALAAYGINPTELRFWDSDNGWPGRSFPDAATIQATGTDSNDYEGRGFAAVMTAQDAARVRNIVVRRYVEPEPAVAVSSTVEASP